KESDSLIKKMLINTAVFTAMSFILALMVSILTNEMFFFWVNYASFAASIAIVMLVTIPVILFLDKQIHFDETMERRSVEHTSELQSRVDMACLLLLDN